MGESAAERLDESLFASPAVEEPKHSPAGLERKVRFLLASGEETGRDGIGVADFMDRFDVDAELAPFGKCEYGDILSARYTETPVGGAGSAREGGLAVFAILQRHGLGPHIEPQGKQLAQARAGNDEAPAVAVEIKPICPALFLDREPLRQRTNFSGAYVQPDGRNFDRVARKRCRRLRNG